MEALEGPGRIKFYPDKMPPYYDDCNPKLEYARLFAFTIMRQTTKRKQLAEIAKQSTRGYAKRDDNFLTIIDAWRDISAIDCTITLSDKPQEATEQQSRHTNHIGTI